MKTKLFITGIATLFVAPAFATPSHTSNTFPADEYMLEDYMYTGQATYTNMGVYSNSVDADADYNDCPANSWCDSSGQHACSSLGDGSYTSSVAGATENTQCYKACTTASIAHSTAVTGNDYYGAGTDTCEPTACENGYHTLDLQIVIGTDAGTSTAATFLSGETSNGTPSNYGISGPMAFAVDYGQRGVITGHGRCSTQIGTNNNGERTTFASLVDETGQSGADYCYCQLDSYTPAGGSAIPLSGPWVFLSDEGPANLCQAYCSSFCARDLKTDYQGDLEFRSALLSSVITPACDVNTITINWFNASAEDIAANEAGTVTYGGDIRTPRAATIIPGKIFVGWKFHKPSQGGE